MIRAVRSAAWRICSTSVRTGRRKRRMPEDESSASRTTVIWLLVSCATPPARRPTASRRWASISFSCRRRFSVTSSAATLIPADSSIRVAEREPGRDPHALDPRLGVRDPADLEVPDRFAGGQQVLELRLDLVGEGRRDLAHAASDQGLHRRTDHLRHALVEPDVPQLAIEHAEAHRRRAVDGLDLTQAGLRLILAPPEGLFLPLALGDVAEHPGPRGQPLLVLAQVGGHAEVALAKPDVRRPEGIAHCRGELRDHVLQPPTDHLVEGTADQTGEGDVAAARPARRRASDTRGR